MSLHRLYYATNRAHLGRDRWRPRAYGNTFSADGPENLRFGAVALQLAGEPVHRIASSNGQASHSRARLAPYPALDRAARARIDSIAAFPETPASPGSAVLFAELHAVLRRGADVLVFIHGFNVGWRAAVRSALALQFLLASGDGAPPRPIVLLFSWPSDGLALPWISYRSDRAEAAASGAALGRALLKLCDYLHSQRDSRAAPCGQNIHLLCHSMGNYVLQHALDRLARFIPGDALPLLFGHVFLCAADVDDDALEPDGPLGSLHRLARSVTVYHNPNDNALSLSDRTKGHPDRLGACGAARPLLLHNKIHQVDCSAVACGLVRHSYHLTEHVAADLRASLAGLPQSDPGRPRVINGHINSWSLRPDHPAVHRNH